MASAVADTDRIAIRRARPGDASAVRVLVHQLGYEPAERHYDETFAQVVRHPEGAVFIAARGARVVGYLALSHRAQIRLGGRIASIDELAVDENARGHGIGGELLTCGITHARSLGCSRLEILCSRARESYERGFYEAHGLDEVETAVYRLELQRPR
jgi:N-acetylglutamate synthase-like GNAT family acetyltransferase